MILDNVLECRKKSKNLIKLGDRVTNEHGEVGHVCPAGPYGDNPFQIKLLSGKHRPFVNEDGTSEYRRALWRVEG